MKYFFMGFTIAMLVGIQIQLAKIVKLLQVIGG